MIKRLLVLSVLVLTVGYAACASAQTLEVWFSNSTSASIQTMVEELIPKFEAAHPGVKVNFTTIGWGTGRKDKLKVAFAAGAGPDIYQLGTEMIMEDVTNGYPMPVEKYVNSWDRKTDFIPQTWEPTKWNGHQYGVPVSLNGRHLIYLQSVFDEAGVAGQKIATWDELLELTRKLHQTDSDGNITRLGTLITSSQFFWFLWQAGGEVTDEVTGTPLFNSKEGRDTIKFFQTLYQVQGMPAPRPTFWSRGVGICVMNTFSPVKNLKQSHPDWIDEVKWIEPMGNNADAPVWPMFITSLGMSSQTKNPDLAWEFIDWFTEPDIWASYHESIGHLPPTYSAAMTPYVQEYMRPMNKIYEETVYARPNFKFPEVSEVNAATSNWIEQARKGEVSPEEALTQIEFVWNSIRERYFK